MATNPRAMGRWHRCSAEFATTEADIMPISRETQSSPADINCGQIILDGTVQFELLMQTHDLGAIDDQ